MNKCLIEGCNNDAQRRTDRPNPKSLCRSCSHLKHKFSMTTPERDKLLEEQDGKCSICEYPIVFAGSRGNTPVPDGFKRAHVDHCHSSGEVRGILCGQCNSALGMLQDDTEVLFRAIEYLEDNK